MRPGISEAKATKISGSFGMELVQSLTKQLKAKLSYQIASGTTVQLIVPEATVTKTAN